jgi:hypothetical protein
MSLGAPACRWERRHERASSRRHQEGPPAEDACAKRASMIMIISKISENFGYNSEKLGLLCKRSEKLEGQSEKFKVNVRNWCLRAILVRNSRAKVRLSENCMR